MTEKRYDLIIIGSGPAGITASIYASRYKLSNLVIGKQLGGELINAHKIENYPGFLSVSGIELAQKMGEQVEKLGARILYEEVGKIEIESQQGSPAMNQKALRSPEENVLSSNRARENSSFLDEAGARDAVYPPQFAGQSGRVNEKTETFSLAPRALFNTYINDRTLYRSYAVIVATGSQRRRLGVPGEEELIGRGVSYCTNCDAPFYRDKVVGVIGGSDAAVTGAIHAAEFAQKIYLIYRGEQLRAEPTWLEELKKLIVKEKVIVIYKTNVIEILSKYQISNIKYQKHKSNIKNEDTDGLVGGVKLDNQYERSDLLELDGLFIEIGGVPGTSLVKPLGVNLTASGHVQVSEKMETNIPGLFCAGDMVDRSQVMQQAITAMAQGAMAASSVYKFLKGSQAPRILGI